MTDHIDTAAEREKLAAILSETYLRCESCNEDMNCHDPSVMWLHHGEPICDSCADAAEIPEEELDSAPDPVRVAARLLDALDAERARSEKAEADLEKYHKCGIVEIAAMNPSVMDYMRHWEGRAEKAEAETKTTGMVLEKAYIWLRDAEAERDQALARLAHESDEALAKVAAAFDASAEACEPFYYDGVGDRMCKVQCRNRIQDLTPADAQAALQRVVDAAWNEAVEACARACALMPDALPASPRMAFEAGLTACEAHIRALKRPEARHE